VVVVVVAVGAVFAPLLAPYGPITQDPAHTLAGSSGAHLLGTDDLGRDIFSRLLFGARTSLIVGLASVTFALAFGTILGTLAGFYGRRLDSLVMRGIDVLLAFPVIILAIMIVVVLGPGVRSLIIAIGVSQVPLFTRLARSLTLSVRSQQFVESAISIGSSNWRILRLHVLPNIVPLLFVQTATTVGLAILNASALNFLGVGIPPPSPDWGRMVADLGAFIFTKPELPLYPGLAIAITVIAMNLLGDGLLKIVDPSGRRPAY
jgi:peptide/nickel transport system permease protein